MTCPVCDDTLEVWEYSGDEPVKAPCPRCGSLVAPSEDDLHRMNEQRTRRKGEGHAAEGYEEAVYPGP